MTPMILSSSSFARPECVRHLSRALVSSPEQSRLTDIVFSVLHDGDHRASTSFYKFRAERGSHATLTADPKRSIASRLVLSGIVIVFVLSLSACATQRYGRATPVSPGERSSLTCERIAIEIGKTEFFVADIQRQRSDTSGAHVLGFLGDFGIGNVMEGNAAEKSGTERLSQLKALQSEKDCAQ